MKKRFDLDRLTKLHSLSDNELRCLKGGKRKGNQSGSVPPPPPTFY